MLLTIGGLGGPDRFLIRSTAACSSSGIFRIVMKTSSGSDTCFPLLLSSKNNFLVFSCNAF